MKNNPFRSNVISRRTDRQTALQFCLPELSVRPLLAQTKTEQSRRGKERRVEWDGEITPMGGAADGEEARI